MNNRERIVIYGAMALLIALNITVLANGRGGEAWAEGPADHAHLGPAGTLTLVDAQDDSLVLRNTDGRLARVGSAVSIPTASTLPTSPPPTVSMITGS